MRLHDEKIGTIPIRNKRISVDLRNGEHNPPHVHIKIGDTSGLFQIQDGKQWRGTVKGKSLVIIKAWILANQSYLKKQWNRHNPSLWLDILKGRFASKRCRNYSNDTSYRPHQPLTFHLSSKNAKSLKYQFNLLIKLLSVYFHSVCRARFLYQNGKNPSHELRYSREVLSVIFQLLECL